MAVERGDMRGSGIAAVSCKAIAREFPIQFIHQAITRDLGDDGGGTDRGLGAIPSHNRGDPTGQTRRSITVHQHMRRRDDQGRHRATPAMGAASFNITAAATTGPAKGPRPASSTPATIIARLPAHRL